MRIVFALDEEKIAIIERDGPDADHDFIGVRFGRETLGALQMLDPESLEFKKLHGKR